MYTANREELANLLAEVVEVESPVHFKEAIRRVLSGAGVQRLGNRILQAFEEAVQLGVRENRFVRQLQG